MTLKLSTEVTIESSEVIPCAFTARVPPTENEQYDCIVFGENPMISKLIDTCYG